MNLAQYLDQYRTRSDRVLYTQWTGDRWKDYTAAEMLDLAARWQQAFRDLGFVPGDRVALCLKNGVHWVAADLAALGMGLVVVPLYVNDNAENIAWCANHAEARLLLLENERLVDSLRHHLLHLRHHRPLQGSDALPSQHHVQRGSLPQGGHPLR
jgi:long-chain acyl-CoA synthetase